MVVEPLTYASDQHGDIGTLTPAVGMKLVQYQIPQALCMAAHSLIGFQEPRHDELKHDVVRQENVRRVLCYLFALFVRFLARVAGKGDRLPALGVAALQKPLEFLPLTVAERVHRIDDDRSDALGGTLGAPPEHIVNNGDEVRKRLSRAGAGCQHIALVPLGDSDRVCLVPMEAEALADPAIPFA